MCPQGGWPGEDGHGRQGCALPVWRRRFLSLRKEKQRRRRERGLKGFNDERMSCVRKTRVQGRAREARREGVSNRGTVWLPRNSSTVYDCNLLRTMVQHCWHPNHHGSLTDGTHQHHHHHQHDHSQHEGAGHNTQTGHATRKPHRTGRGTAVLYNYLTLLPALKGEAPCAVAPGRCFPPGEPTSNEGACRSLRMR